MTDARSPANSNGNLKVLETASEILEIIDEDGETGVTEISDRLDVPTSTAHTYLKTLERCGFLVKEDRRYRLGLRFLRHGGSVRNENELYKVAKPEIDELARRTGELANLGVEEDGKRVLLYKSDGERAVYDDAPTGEFTHMHWSALGKAILAHRPTEHVDDVVDRHGLPRGTKRTITDRDRLRSELATIRQRGYALENENRVEGLQAVAMPILNDEEAVGAVAISGPKHRLSEERIDGELVEQLRTKVNITELKYSHY